MNGLWKSGYNPETKRWEDEDGGAYAYVLFECDGLFAREWIYAHSFKDAMSTAEHMIRREGKETIEIGLPNGHTISINAQYANAQFATDPTNDSN
jgi:hypothetical protein